MAYVIDENEDEKAKGKTVEIGRANFDTPKKDGLFLMAQAIKTTYPI